MNTLLFTVGALAFVMCAWLYMARYYKKLYHHSLKWWAVPMANGSLLLGRRLPPRMER